MNDHVGLEDQLPVHDGDAAPTEAESKTLITLNQKLREGIRERLGPLGPGRVGTGTLYGWGFISAGTTSS